MKLEQFLEKTPPPGRLIFAKVWGSRSHNTHKTDSDYDFSGVYALPTSQLLSLDASQETMSHDTGDGRPLADKLANPDHSFHELRKFAGLVLVGNPSILEMVFTERECIMTPEWEALRSIRRKFLSQESVKQYLGYMQGQLKRLTNEEGKRGLHTKGGAYNEKWAYHILRLAGDAKRIAKGGEPVVWKDGPERDFLMRVRNNEFDWPEVKTLIEHAIAEIDGLKPWNIPEVGDRAALNEWLLDIRRKNW